MIPYPEIDPVAVAIGPLKIRWYGLMYLIGFAIAWFLARSRAKRPEFGWKIEWVDDLIFYAALGLILGARIGYMLFYGADTWTRDPVAILKVWEGGMSFHGGLLGLALCVWLYARKKRLAGGDLTARVEPSGPPEAVEVGRDGRGDLPPRTAETRGRTGDRGRRGRLDRPPLCRGRPLYAYRSEPGRRHARPHRDARNGGYRGDRPQAQRQSDSLLVAHLAAGREVSAQRPGR